VTYVWARDGWPQLRFDLQAVQGTLYRYAMEANVLKGSVAQLADEEETEVLIDLMVSEAIKTSAIEGEDLDRRDVRSSIRNQLGLDPTPEPVRDPRAHGIAALMISVRRSFREPLTRERLFAWHEMVIADPALRRRIPVGAWRDAAIQIVSGPIGREVVHFDAPPPRDVPAEMARFLDWFNATAPKGKPSDLAGPVRAAVAHLHFECIHPFADGNGRIGRAISEIALSQELDRPVLLSLSRAIEAERKKYYEALAAASQGGLDITHWVRYFVDTVLEAQLQARATIAFVLEKARFWDRFGERVNERQRKALARMFRAGPEGFAGGISAKKYASITGASKATATRDLADLLREGALRRPPGGGRSTRYELALGETGPHDPERPPMTSRPPFMTETGRS
jgi:Fic family protein